MRCPYCNHNDTQVKSSRQSDDGLVIRRRRQCPQCGSRFNTFERVQFEELSVVKSNRQKKPFDPAKISSSIRIAARKRPISNEQIDEITHRITAKLERRGESDISTMLIGELVMEELKKIDDIAYIRFASVYRNFREAKEFEKLMEEVIDKVD